MKKHTLTILAVSFFFPLETFAHGSHGTGFIAGLTHPIFGLDHLVAIIGISLLGFSLLKEKQWLPSLAFIIAMIIGGLLGIHAEELGITEYVIVSSVLATGLTLTFDLKISAVLFVIIAPFFGFFHGHAHGTEMPEASNIPLYILGFVIGVILISAIGFGISKLLKENSRIRLLGAFIAGMGLMMLIG